MSANGAADYLFRSSVEIFEASRVYNVTKGPLATIYWSNSKLPELGTDLLHVARFLAKERVKETKPKKRSAIRRMATRFMI